MDQIRMLIWEAAVVIGALLRPAAKSVRENSGLAVLSVVLAFGLWIFVTDAENPEQTHRLDSDIPVRPVNVPADVWVPKEVGKARVEVRVEDKVFDSLTTQDFEATADLTGLTVGAFHYGCSSRSSKSKWGAGTGRGGQPGRSRCKYRNRTEVVWPRIGRQPAAQRHSPGGL